MAITLSDGTTTIELPADLAWPDEFDWSDIEQEREYSLTGATIVQQGVKTSGRPITLESAGASWVTRTTAQALQVFYNAPEQEFTLDINGALFTAQFERPGGFKAEEVVRLANPGPEHFYTITLKFFEVAA